jgi:RNA polymerase sigma-70 factor (ECF subfamily)
MIDSDEILVRSAQRGDGAAFEELVRRTSRLAFARLYLETGDIHLSEDLLQETLLTAFRSLDQLTEPAKFRAWLLRIAQNRAIDAARRNLRQKRLAGRSEQAALANQSSGQAQPGEEAERSELRQQVLVVLRTLPEEYRLPLTMRYLSGANYETIQTQMGLTNGSLRGLLHRGMNMLRAELERVLGKELRLHREERTGE